MATIIPTARPLNISITMSLERLWTTLKSLVVGNALGNGNPLDGGEPLPFHGEVKKDTEDKTLNWLNTITGISGGWQCGIPTRPNTIGDGHALTIAPGHFDGRVFFLDVVQDLEIFVVAEVGLGNRSVPFPDLDEIG